MDGAGKNGVETMYFRCRKEAAIHNDRLNSRAGAAEALGISESSLAKHELGITKFVPVDLVALMADLYGCPELKANYCKNECPLGRDLTLATEVSPIERVTLNILSGLSTGKIEQIKQQLIDIAADGVIDSSEAPQMRDIVDYLGRLAKSVAELQLLCEKQLRDGERR
jgi:hypothetical protein